MEVVKLILKENKENPNHHIWANGAVWWCNMTVHHKDGTSERRRFSLKTKDIELARRRRDNIFRDIEKYSLHTTI